MSGKQSITALVTGGAGYFGSLLAGKLKQRGYRVRIFDINPYTDPLEGMEIHQGDIRDAEAVQRACSDVDVVFHNVAQVPLAASRALFWSVNAAGTETLMDSCIRAGVRSMVYTSSSAIYGVPDRNPVTEEMAPEPDEEYGRAKLKGEEICAKYSGDRLSVSTIRPRTILGHGRLGIFQILFEWLRTGYNIPVLGRGDNRYQFVHADDLADACILAAEVRKNDSGFRAYNIGSDRFGTMRETLEELCEHAGTGSRVKSVPMWPAIVGMKMTHMLGLSPLGPYHSLMYGREMFFDISRAQNELKYRPRYSNIEMIIDSYDWYVQNRAEVMSTRQASHHRSPVKEGVLGLVKRLL